MKILYVLPILFFTLVAADLETRAGANTAGVLMVEGVIGDCAHQSRTFEINGIIYILPSGLTIENSRGERLDYQGLHPGRRVQIYRRTDETPEEEEKCLDLIVIDGVQASWSPARIVVLPSPQVPERQDQEEKPERTYPNEIIFENGV